MLFLMDPHHNQVNTHYDQIHVRISQVVSTQNGTPYDRPICVTPQQSTNVYSPFVMQKHPGSDDGVGLTVGVISVTEGVSCNSRHCWCWWQTCLHYHSSLLLFVPI